jgi:hypothetical protein
MSTTFRGVLASRLNALSEPGLTSALASPESSLPAPTAQERSVWESIVVTELLERASTDLTSPWPTPLASAAARVHRDGNRDEWEAAAFARQERLSRAAILAAHTLDTQWIDQVVDGIQLLCEQSSWCWPAHDDTYERHGSVLATVTAPYLDLGAGEAVGQLAWIDHILGSALDERAPGIRERIRHEARTRVFTPFLERRDWHWIGLDGDVHNWNPWIHGNVLVAALRLLDGPHEASLRPHVVALVMEGIDRYVSALPEDGAIDEGYGYWWNGACRALEALDVFGHATGRNVIAQIPALRETVAFPHRCHLGDDWYVNFADSQARPTSDQPWHALHRAARLVGNEEAAAHAAAHRSIPAHESMGFGRLVRALTDPEWNNAPEAAVPLVRDTWLPSTQVLLSREQTGVSEGLSIAIKGGHNDEHHNHNDVGSLIVACDGVPVIVDAGRPTYTKQTFGPGRYDIWTMQSSWHSVPEIRGCPQAPGAQQAARDVTATLTEVSAGLTLDLADAYPNADLQTWRRTVRLDRKNRQVTLDEAWEFNSSSVVEHETTTRLLIAGTVELEPGQALVQPLQNATPIIIRWPNDTKARRVEQQLKDPLLGDVWGPHLTRIDLIVTHRRDIRITIEQHNAPRVAS